MEPIHLLVTLDQNYLPPLRVMLHSLFVNNPGEHFHIHMLYDGITPEQLQALAKHCARHGSELHPVEVGADTFADAPVWRYYTRAMYYRLLSCTLLSHQLVRALYLDPDILIINPIRPLYETDLGEHLFGAAAHTDITGLVDPINKLRLGTPQATGYYNSGVLLMNLARQRRDIRPQEVYDYVREHKNELLMPDQDILNVLYGHRVLPLDDSLYNYDAHRYETYRMASGGEKDIDWVMRHTAILHYNGRVKPWMKPSRGRFGVLYRHYMALAERDQGPLLWEPAKKGVSDALARSLPVSR